MLGVHHMNARRYLQSTLVHELWRLVLVAAVHNEACVLDERLTCSPRHKERFDVLRVLVAALASLKDGAERMREARFAVIAGKGLDPALNVRGATLAEKCRAANTICHSGNTSGHNAIDVPRNGTRCDCLGRCFIRLAQPRKPAQARLELFSEVYALREAADHGDRRGGDARPALLDTLSNACFGSADAGLEQSRHLLPLEDKLSPPDAQILVVKTLVTNA